MASRDNEGHCSNATSYVLFTWFMFNYDSFSCGELPWTLQRSLLSCSFLNSFDLGQHIYVPNGCLGPFSQILASRHSFFLQRSFCKKPYTSGVFHMATHSWLCPWNSWPILFWSSRGTRKGEIRPIPQTALTFFSVSQPLHVFQL